MDHPLSDSHPQLAGGKGTEADSYNPESWGGCDEVKDRAVEPQRGLAVPVGQSKKVPWKR